jgi:ABC-type nitrate/sulfonate/bicarbonate transport system substrate-binding protein
VSTQRSADGEDVSVGLVAPAYVCAPLWIAQRRGLLERVGIRAAVEICGTTDRATEAARSGAVQFALTAPEGAIVDAMTGGGLRLIAGLTNRPPLSLIAQARYHSIEDLRQARIGTSSLTEGTRHIVEEMLTAHGLVHGRDYEFVLAGAHPQRWEALRRGTIDAALQLIPFDYIAEEAGFANLGAAATYVPEFAFSTVCAQADWAQAHRGVVVRFLAALLDAVDWLYLNVEAAAAIAAAESNTELRHALRACRELTEQHAIPRDLEISQNALARTIESMRASGVMPDHAPRGPASAIDRSYLHAAADMRRRQAAR